ncbi:AbrB/MazE/SpoVT family DNA-binding domain-containing protein [Neorhizobium galegae]|nr:AbrB/MazE/SpoVT family DNA-binding domain-containing protein [Neorhizobium galegae]
MTETVKISPENQITLSAEALALLGVKAGDQVDIVPSQDGHLEIRAQTLDIRGPEGDRKAG